MELEDIVYQSTLILFWMIFPSDSIVHNAMSYICELPGKTFDLDTGDLEYK